MTKEEAIRKLTQLKNKYLDEYVDYDNTASAYDMAIEALHQPERKKGKWIKAYPTNPDVWMCSECHYIDEPKWAYCRNCGTEME